MTHIDLLSDTTYRQQAVRQLHPLLGNATNFPVESSQIYGLRQIARQQPDRVSEFAEHQGERAEKLGKQNEVDFWALVAKLCKPSTADWSLYKEGHAYLPEDIRAENIPKKQKGMPEKERARINGLENRQKKELQKWVNAHIPAFFQRFCTECMYRKAMIEMRQSTNESDVSAHQEENKSGGSQAMRQAFVDAER